MQEAKQYETLSYRVADNGVAFIAIDVPDRKVNVLTPELHREVGEVAAHLAADDTAVGAVIHSGKPSFMAGGDLKRIVQYYDMNRSAQQAYEQSRTFTESLRALETCGMPVAVAINGNALGGGLELTLACHHRVVLDDDQIMLGLPEVTLGLIPGAGGTQRLPRLIGIKKAADLILTGETFSPAKALALGIVDQLADAGDLLGAAQRWVLEADHADQPWDRKGYRMPGGAGLGDPRVGGLFVQLTARVGSEHRHNYPAPVAALRSLFNGTTVRSMDQALKIETREFSALTRDPVARNIIRTLFINKGKRRRAEKESPQEYQDRDARVAELCQSAYDHEGKQLAGDGVSAALIDNAALIAGMAEPPQYESGSARPGVDGPEVQEIVQRLLTAQALAVANEWANGTVDSVDADLASISRAGFPSYTGGVLSYVDTMGLTAFTTHCDELASRYGRRFEPSGPLRDRAAEIDRVYPPEV